MKSFKDLQTEATKQTKKGVIAKAARKGTPPYTVVVLDRLNKVVKQETTQVADAVPAFVHELQKRYPKGDYKISVEDKGGSRVYSEEVEMEEGTSASQRGEPQTPHTQKQYDALSPKDKKLVDARVKAARKQSMSRNPSESPRNYKKRKPKTRRGGVSKYGRGQTGPLPKNEEEDVKEGIVILPKRSSRGGDVKEVGKDKRGGKTQYWWRHKNGLKNVYDSLEKLRYALRNDANFKDAEEITKQLGEAVNEGGMGRMKDPHTIRYVDPKQKDTTNISVVDGEREAKKFLAKVKKKGMSGTIKKGSEQPGSIQTVKYNQSTDQLNKASRYDTLTGKRK